MTAHATRGPGTRELVLAWLPAALYMATIWLASSFELRGFPTSMFPLRDKGVHAIEYGVLGFLLAHACVRTFVHHARARVAAVAILAGVLWGVLDEIHQAFVPGRSADAIDLVADSIGVTAGVLARLAVARLRTPEPAAPPTRTPTSTP